MVRAWIRNKAVAGKNKLVGVAGTTGRRVVGATKTAANTVIVKPAKFAWRHKSTPAKAAWRNKKEIVKSPVTSYNWAKGKADSNARRFILLAAIIWLIDIFWGGFKGISLKFLSIGTRGAMSYGIFNILFIALAFIILYWYRNRKRSLDSGEILSLIPLALMTAIILVDFYIVTFLHLLFALYFWGWYLRKTKDLVEANIMASLMLFLDLFFFPLAGQIFKNASFVVLTNKILMPVWLFATILYAWDEATWVKILGWAIIILFLMYSYNSYKIYFSDDLAYIKIRERLTDEDVNFVYYFFKTSINNAIDFGGDFITLLTRMFDPDYYVGYVGTVEENAEIELGVFLEDVEPLSKSFYSTSAAIIRGKVRAKALTKEVKVTVSCEAENPAWAKEGKPIDGYVPDKEFSVYLNENRFVECIFDFDPNDPKKLKEPLEKGYYNVKMKVNYDFQTLSFLKSYFIHNDRKRALEIEGIDLRDYYDIKETDQVAIYTSGPISIGMQTDNLINGVSNDARDPRLNFAITNIGGGKISKINKLYVLVHKSILLGTCTPNGFSKVGSNICGEFCETGNQECIDECDDYNIYAFNVKNPDLKDFVEDIKVQKVFNCPLEIINQNSLLDNKPFAIRFFRIMAEYDYESEALTNMYIKEPET